MDTLILYAIWGGVILIALGLVIMAFAGLRSLFSGKVNPVSAAVIMVPAVTFVILGGIVETWAHAAVWTFFVMFVLSFVALVLSGVRGLFT